MQFLKFIGAIVAIFSVGLSIYSLNRPTLAMTPDESVQYVKQVLHYGQAIQTSFASSKEQVKIDTAHYDEVKVFIENQRKNWAANNNLSIAKDSISYLLGDSLATSWIGTPWDFNGVSKKPQCGNIACGYFVYGLLEDAGFYLPRIKLSQATSEASIKALIGESHIKRFSNKEMDEFLETMTAWGDGIYLVGLDYHIGILQVKGDDIQMIHSSVYPPVSVVIEDAATSLALTHTAYRIVGKLDNETTMNKWLKGTYFTLN